MSLLRSKNSKVMLVNGLGNYTTPEDNQTKISTNSTQSVQKFSDSPILNKKPRVHLKQNLKNKLEYYFKLLKDKYCQESHVVGLDLRPNIIRIAISEEIDGVWKVKNLFSKQVSNNFNYDSFEKNKNVYIAAIKELFAENKIKNHNVAISLPTSQAIIKNITMPLMTEESLSKATNISSFWQNLVQISDNLKEYAIFYKIARKIPASNEMDVLFVALKHKDIKVYTDILKAAMLEALVIDVSCFSLNNLEKLKADDGPHATKVVMKIGSDENFLQIMDSGKPYIYDIFVPENEKLYLNEYIEHSTFQTRFIAQVKHIITKHKEKYGIEISDIELITSSNNITTFLESLKEAMPGITIALSDLYNGIVFSKDIHKKLDLSSEEQSKNEWAIAIGLSTRRIELFPDKADQQISDKVNLAQDYEHNTDKLKAQFISKIALSLIGSCVGILLLLSAVIFFAQYRYKVREVTRFNELNNEYLVKNDEFKKIVSDNGQLMKVIKANENVGSNQDLVITSLNDISSTIPDGVWLRKIEFNDKGEVKISGIAMEEKNILKFSRDIDASEVIKNSFIDSIKIKADESGAISREFTINGRYLKEKPVEPVPEAVPAATQTPKLKVDGAK